ncbi:ATP synthase F1 subcomplex delta subunit [Granulicella rosea]|uniref:ATP synthase subunit delta n=1 Tax=Granulicella rosea TaxID=474952 RepID=A0A239E417_9BACT|nr:ATP synthase F1 subunit delta [Granulicella rosea]SNS39490.1 ATP synthase F1 subcomplex delta subunit [Granulicella rosea]
MAVFAPRYARAFAAVAASKNLDVAAAQQQLQDFAGTFAGSRELREVLTDPSIKSAQKLKVLDAIASRIGMFREVRNFVAVVMDHEHLNELGEILAAYHELADESLGFSEAAVVSAHELTVEDRAELEAQVSKLVGGAKVRVAYSQDASLLGGAVVRIGSTIYDGSVKAQFAQLKQKLINA